MSEFPAVYEAEDRLCQASGSRNRSRESQVDLLLHCMGDDVILHPCTLRLEGFEGYVDKGNVISAQAKFNRRKQGESEMVADFILILHQLVVLCQYGDLWDEMVRDCIVVGVNFRLSFVINFEESHVHVLPE